MQTSALSSFFFFSRKRDEARVSWEACVVNKNKIITGESPLVPKARPSVFVRRHLDLCPVDVATFISVLTAPHICGLSLLSFLPNVLLFFLC